ncbi:TMV resistance protein N [Trifolium repens]|nr:TMV resistance protein N [Trifolium repens]
MEDSSVEKEIQSLVPMRDRLRVAFEAIDDKTEKVSVEVFEWLDETEIIIQRVENLTAQTNTRKECKKLMRRIIEQRFKLYGFHDDLSLEYSSSGNFVSEFVCFNSREKASDQLFMALKLNRCSIIGLYGRSGSGKTTLVKAMARKARSLYFSEVLFVNVTQSPNIRTLQDEIADSLNIKFDKNSEAGRAKTIFSRIKTMTRILVIVDDVPAKFNLDDLGISCNNDRYSSPKTILTTCCRQDCDLMYTQMDIQLGPLSTEDSWTLFQKHSGIDDEDSSSFDLLNVAREVAFECEGLPGKIKDVGSSLRSKPIEEWKATLDSLKHSMAKWQIFLSFRGKDTRDAFTGSLYKDLCQGGFKTFMDDGGLDTGDQISPSLLNAIEASRLSIIVLSENYANSSWCLEELVKIMECMKLKKQLVWPIFYKVDPSDIRHLTKSYGKDMAQHENNYGINSERVHKWKSALFEVSNLSGKTYTNGYEHEFIQKIVEDANLIKSRLQIRSI